MQQCSPKTLALVGKCPEPKVAFFIQRWVELLDPNTPFYFSIHLEMSPLESIKDTLSLLNIYEEKSNFVAFHMISSARRTVKILKEDSLISKRSYVQCSNLINNLSLFLKELDKIGQSSAGKKDLRAEFIKTNIVSLRTSLQGSASELSDNYISDSVNNLELNLRSQFQDTKRYRKIDSLIINIARFLIDRGQSPRECLNEIFRYMDSYDEINRDQIIGFINFLLGMRKEQFRVAVVLDGISRIEDNYFPETLIQQAKTVRYGRYSWGVQAPTVKLEIFCKDHWARESSKNSKSKFNKAVVKIITVDAWDIEDARRQALSVAESITDLLNAGNRNKRVGVKRKVLVLTPDGREIRKQGDTRVSRALRPISLNSHQKISNSLRFASRVKTERSESVGILFAWISLESFFSGTPDAQKKVIHVIPPLGARAASRGIISYCRKIIEIEVNSSDELFWDALFSDLIYDKNHYPTLDSMHDSLRSQPLSRGNEIYDKKLSPFARYRLDQISLIVKNGDSYSSYISNIQEKIGWCLARIAHLRNQTVHSAASEGLSERSLAPICWEVLDFTFEVVGILDKGNVRDYQLEIEKYSSSLRDEMQSWGRDNKVRPQMLGTINHFGN